MVRYFSRLKENEDGQSLVEFALVFVFVLIPVLFGIIQFGFIFGGQIVMTGAAREGARMAIVGEDNGLVLERMENYIKAAGFITYEKDSAVITPENRENTDIGDELSIDLFGSVPIIVPFIDFLTDEEGNYPISSSAIMRIEQQGGVASP